jgi:hypothetical protein
VRQVARMLLNLHKPVSDYLALNLCPKWADSAFYGPLLVVLTQEGYEGSESWYKIIMGGGVVFIPNNRDMLFQWKIS